MPRDAVCQMQFTNTKIEGRIIMEFFGKHLILRNIELESHPDIVEVSRQWLNRIQSDAHEREREWVKSNVMYLIDG